MILGQRYKNDGQPTLKLNNLQLENKKQIENKVRDQIYQFEQVPCPICQIENQEVLSEKDRYGLYMPVVICKDCGLIRTSPRMNQKAYNQFYNIEYRPLYVGTEKPTAYFFEQQYVRGKRMVDLIQQHQKITSETFVVEIGCGAGGILKSFKDKGAQVFGNDLGEKYIQYGKETHNLNLQSGTIHDLDLDQKANVIVYSHVMEHILDPVKELEKVKEILDPNGLLYIEVPGIKNLATNYKSNFLAYLQNAHTFHFSLSSLQNLLKQLGFELITGNEKVEALFCLKKDSQMKSEISNDYQGNVLHLQQEEKVFKKGKGYFYLTHPKLFLSETKRYTLSLLDKLGLRKYIKALRKKIGI